MTRSTVDSMCHECTVDHASGQLIVSRDDGRTWTMPWYIVDNAIVPKRVIVKSCPFCGIPLK